VVKVPGAKVVVPRMFPFWMVTLRSFPVMRTPVPEAGLAVEAMVKPFKSSVTLSALTVTPLPEATGRFPARK